MGSMDFMVPVSRASPKNKTEVLVRIDKHHITKLVYDNGFPMDNVVSWLWLNGKCSCHKLRWELDNVVKGKCKKCGTLWKESS